MTLDIGLSKILQKVAQDKTKYVGGMWILIVFLGLWLFYYAFKFNVLERRETVEYFRFYSYFIGKLNRMSPKDLGFILTKANTSEGKRSKFLANMLLMFFYIDLIILIFIKDIIRLLN